MKVKIVFTLIIITLATTLTACIDFFLPIYEKTNDDGMSVIIDGVRYKEFPILKWIVHPTWPEKKIGYAGGWDTVIVEAQGDTEKNFVYIKGTIADYYDGFLYRTDKVIPEPSAESINKMIWEEYVVGSEEGYINTIVDKKIIKELFDILDSEEKTRKYEMIENNSKILNISIGCYSSDLPGALYLLAIGKSGDKIICGNRRENEYVEIPIELLVKISGRSADYFYELINQT